MLLPLGRSSLLLSLPLLLLQCYSQCSVEGFHYRAKVKQWGNSHNHCCASTACRNARVTEVSIAHEQTETAALSRQKETQQQQLKFKNFEELLRLHRDEPVLVLFTSMNCGPCRLQKKELAAALAAESKKLKCFAIDTEKWPHVGSRFQVGKLPCLMVVKEEKVLVRLDGLVKADVLVERIQSYLL